jgi:DNA-binding transcriptional LysR family regulator
MDRLESMSVFVSVIGHGSFSAASRALRMPLPSVSRKVAELETQLGARLLIRSTRKLTLTEAGESYLQACKRILEEVAEAERTASGQYRAPRGELVITAPVVFGRLHIVPVVAEFLRAHADVDVRLMLTDRTLNLIDDNVDIAARIGKLRASHLVAINIGHTRHVVCGAPAYLREHGTPRTPQQLRSHHCITFGGLAGESWTFRGERPLAVRSRLVVNTADSAIDGALAGLGLTRVLSYQIAEAVKTGRLVTLLKRYEPPASPISLLYLQEKRVTAKVRAFIDFAVPKLRADAISYLSSPQYR